MRYLVGSPIYRGASNAPTRGTVDPMGYINRGLGMSPVGGDGLSDKRSGLAHAALNRLRGVTGISAQQPSGMRNELPVTLPNRSINTEPSPVFGHIVTATGQLMPMTANPAETTYKAMNGASQEDPGVSETQLMQAARDRLQHRIATKEMLTQHQVKMHELAFKKAEAINRHRQKLTGLRGRAYAD